MPIVATAAWSIPKPVASRFPQEGSGLSRYATVLAGVEVNSTFYRRHRSETFGRWAQSVPEDFRFAVKIPQEITHRLRLKGVGPAFRAFLADIAPLGEKCGPLLCQLPPSLVFDAALAGEALAQMRDAHAGPIVLEARHESWASDRAMTLLERHFIDRVLADPPLVWHSRDFAGPPRYVRLHGKPKLYHSNYSEEDMRAFLDLVAQDGWCVFDNTASGFAVQNALAMADMLAAGRKERTGRSDV